MKPTLASYIDFLAPFISPDLISEPYLSRIYQIAERLPVLSFGSFECWLDANEPRVDFNVCINPRINEHITMRDWEQKDIGFENDIYQEMRQRIRSFCTTWSQNDFFLKPLMGELWEVYDIVNPNDSQLPVPWVYISFLKNFLDEDQTIKAEIISKILPLIDSTLSSDLKEEFLRVVLKVPSSVRVGPIGILKRNEKTSLRLFLEVKTFEELMLALKTIEWPGSFDEFREKVAPWAQARRYLGVTLDFDGSLQPKVGIECHFRLGHWQEDLSLFTQNLCDQKLSSVAKRNAILDWGADFEVETTPDFWSWPSGILSQNRLQKIKVRRIVNFVKIIFEPNKELITKVYPLFYRSLT